MKEFYCPNCKKKTKLNKFGACERCGFIPPVKEETQRQKHDPLRPGVKREKPTSTAKGSANLGNVPLKIRLKEAGYITDKVWVINQPVIIGRHDPQRGKVDIDLTPYRGSEYVSRQHAKIYLQGGVWYITDLRSSNGTFLNGKILLKARPLKNGDIIAIGTLKLLVKIEEG